MLATMLASTNFIFAQDNLSVDFNATENNTIGTFEILDIPTCMGEDQTIEVFGKVMNASEIELMFADITNLYNNCSSDLAAGYGCGTMFIGLKDANGRLADKNDALLKEVGNLEGFRKSFYVVTVILVILALWLIYLSARNKS